jgi:ubiquinone/menaquinone biosynthesis C-methylase UbiE
MNEYELSQNPQLTSFQVKDLNKDPTLPYPDNSFDKVTCVVSVDYLNKPKQIFQEVGRVLRPGGECMLTMSNRWYVTFCCIQVSRSTTIAQHSLFRLVFSFPTKAFQIWLQTNDLEHIFIAGSFFHYAGMFEPPSCDDISPNPGRSDPLWIVRAKKKIS